MLQGRQQGEACPAVSLSLASRQENCGMLQQQQQGADMELPQDMARQALAATGGKSNLMATKWLLERRAEVAQQHVEADLMSEIGQQMKGTEALKKPRNDEDLGSLLPSTSAVWANNGLHHTGPEKVSPFAAGERPASDKRSNHTPIDWLGSSNPLERHASIGSSSPLGREDIGEAKLQLKLQPVVGESQQPAVKASKLSLSPESEDVGKMNVPKLSTAALQDVSSLKRKWQEEVDAGGAKPSTLSPINVGLKQQTAASGKTPASLAERMRPNSIAEILGQDHLLGPHCALRSLLDAECLPSIVFGGPPGTGKTSLARLIARSASCRFVAFPPLKGNNTEFQEILDEAKQARKFGQRTVLFVENVSRFSKSQQECLLPALEAGYVIFIGATTENSSAELISSLVLRCRIIVLKKLQPEHLCIAMKRAISDLDRGVLVSLGDVCGIEVLAIEDEVIQYLANAADGDARLALNALEAAVYIALGKLKCKRKVEVEGKGLPAVEADDPSFRCSVEWEKSVANTAIAKMDSPHKMLEHLKGYFQFSQEEYAKPFKKIVGGKEVMYGVSRDREAQKLSCDVDKDKESTGFREMREREKRGGDILKGTNEIEGDATLVVTMVDAKEALRWPQVVLEKFQEESDRDLMSALLKSIKGGDSNAAIYWLARILETSEGPTKVAESLVKFASEEVGIVDPQALVQASTCHQACQLLGMKDCSSHLTQCVVYLAMAPKSDAMPQAFQLAQKVVQDGINEPVPVHLRSMVSGGFVKELGYLPTSLRDHTFLKWPDA